MTATLTQHGRSLVEPDLFHRLAARVAHDEQVEPSLADRIVDQTLAFLAACAADHDEPLAPSPLVDLGWHTFILYTRDYADFCQRVAGRFLHHAPTDGDEPGDLAELRDRTVLAIASAGFAVDQDMWSLTGKCTQCYAGCSDSPKK